MSTFYLPTFRDQDLWQLAITHKSYAKEHECEDNERLEFLGDAILTFLSGEYLYQRYPERSEGELTPLRASLVDENQLSYFASQLDLQKYLRLSRGAENSDSRNSKRVLCSTFEALIGAYFLDSDQDIETLRAYVIPMFDSVADQASETALQINYKSRFQIWSLDQLGEVPTYKIIAAIGPDHAKQFTAEVRVKGLLYGQGTGRRKQDAEKKAAQAALKRVGIG
ncbi:ribonuclease III [Leptolyngbya cf. ectocarpi LEGE 11479]|uniref:Ribonuclease 3 n=1 Tax=Leptolyngbya cf. ectocarpi LEGE 11479 TaxID=1828722 RepID=A0A928ZU11_LEPEC|nr:ribonuclease III [Leptolyngbya ectocarpi]MBE9067442.1 ribonuclease III [Leptolyngbya cf. ectocarpi LEGE 11479]